LTDGKTTEALLTASEQHAMDSTTLLLGPVVFQDFEVPCGINFGGKQRLAVHRLPGGVRVIDTLGRDDADICFSGIFCGSNATLRARLLDEMRALGALLPLTWDVFFYTVVISQFQADYATSNWIPYKITCTVLRDEASALIETALTLGATVLSDIGTAVTQAASGGVDLSSLQSSVSDPSATVRDTAAYGQAQVGIAGAQSSLAGAIDNAQTALPPAAVTSSGTAESGVANLTSAVSAAQQVSQLAVAQAYVGRAAINLANAST
jgi:hypothetical protein